MAEKQIEYVFAYSPIVFTMALLVGLVLDVFYPLRIIPGQMAILVGSIFLFLSPFLILWAQRSSFLFRKRKRARAVRTEDFCIGPYKFIRHPTYLGLSFLVLGFGLLLNSIFIIAGAILAFLITHLLLLRREEKLLAEKYGDKYQNYRNSTRCWI